MFIQLAFLISSVALISAGSISKRIAGGQPATVSEVPWQASLVSENLCGAVIYSDQIVLTAAHCVGSDDLKRYTVRVGSSSLFKGGQAVKIANITRHEKYQGLSNYFSHDVAVIRLQTKLRLGDNVRPIPLANTAPRVGTPLLVSGWGEIGYKKKSETLLKVAVNIVDRSDCEKYFLNITEDKICAAANGKNSCRGDSGGPLVFDGKLVGIVSYGNACANPYFPGVYANVAELRPWIENAVNARYNNIIAGL